MHAHKLTSHVLLDVSHAECNQCTVHDKTISLDCYLFLLNHPI